MPFHEFFFLGSYRCICNRGYKPDLTTSSTKCVDVNECLQRPGPCEHECTNSWGSYACSCPQGYVLNSDGKTCRDLDECATGSHTCQYECINTLGNIDKRKMGNNFLIFHFFSNHF